MNQNHSVLIDLSTYLHPQRVIMLESGITKDQALRTLATATANEPSITEKDAFIQAIFEREEVSSTGVGGGIAVPHAKLPFNLDFVITIGICPDGIDFNAKDGEPVAILIMIAAPESERTAYLRVLATVAAMLKNREIVESLRLAQTGQEAIVCLTPAKS